MKILFCITGLGYGGAEKNLRMVANHMRSLGHEIIICTVKNEPPAQQLDEGIRIVPMPQYGKKGLKRFQQLSFLKKLMAKERPDVSVSFLAFPNFFSIVAGKLTGTPTIVSERSDPYQVSGAVMKFMYSMYKSASGAVFQTENARDYFAPAVRKKSRVIANPVEIKDETLFTDYENAEKSIAYSARFDLQQKRQDVMLEAFKTVVEKHPEYVLKFFGDGPDEEKMKAYAEELGIADNVKFCGRSSNVLSDISVSELFVLSSDYEGIPNALLEAMSIGLPCVSTDCSPGGARMLIESGENGIIVPTRDPAALSDALCKMIENRDMAISCGKKAIEVRERFSKPRILSMWEEYITETALAAKKKGESK